MKLGSVYKLPEHHIWRCMLDRCYNKRAVSYPNYGGRGIKVCVRWRKSFKHFYADLGKRPEKGMDGKYSLDRINNNRDYKPSNCRWATGKEQARNRRGNKRITYKGNTKTMTEWAEILGIPYRTFAGRIHQKAKVDWTLEEIFETPVLSKESMKMKGFSL